jgi:hypothetical protein
MMSKSKNAIRQRALEAIREQQRRSQLAAILQGTIVEQYPDPAAILNQLERDTRSVEEKAREEQEVNEARIMEQIQMTVPDGFRVYMGGRDSRGWRHSTLESIHAQERLKEQIERQREEQREREARAQLEQISNAYSFRWYDEAVESQAVIESERAQEEAERIAAKPRPEVKIIRGARRIRI